MQELFVAFLQEPTAGIVPRHPRRGRESPEVRRLLPRPQPDGRRIPTEAIRRREDRSSGKPQPNLLLSPGRTCYYSLAMREEGNTQGADMERFICFRCMDGIRLTGDGTQEHPFLRARTSDEYDLL